MRWQLLTALFILAVMITSCASKEAPMPPVVPTPAPTPAPEPAPEPVVDEGPMVYKGDYMATKEDGIIRGVGCDPESNTIFFELHNPTDNDWTFYERVVPTPPNMIRVVLNGNTLTEMECDAETLAPGTTVKCSKTGAAPEDKVVFQQLQRSEENDRLSVKAVGHRDELRFRCQDRGIYAEE